MINQTCRLGAFLSRFFLAAFCLMSVPTFTASADEPKAIVINNDEEPIRQRMERTITLDVRDMNIVDVIKFLALKGEFNVVISPTVEGRSTVLLNNVSINDALDIVIISNKLAYKIENNIVAIMTAAEYESMFGKSFSDKTVVETVHLNYSKPSYVLAALDSIKSNVGKIIIDEDTGSVVMIDTVDAIQKMKTALLDIEKPLETFVYTLQYAKADVVADQLRQRIDSKAVGAISSDERANKIVVRAFPDRLDEIKKIVAELDSPNKEVLVDARIIQVILNPEYDAGIDWQYDFKDSSIDALKKIKFDNFYLGKQNTALSGSDNLFSHYGQVGVGNINSDEFQATIRALKQVSDTKILSNPKILVLNNEEARIHIGDTVPYIISTTSGTGDNAITSEDVRFVDVGLKLNVRPTINDDGYITMRMRPEISSVVARIESNGGGIPQVNKTEVETTVVVKDGNTIILGGLRKDDKLHKKKGLPLLMDAPVIGKFFSRAQDSMTNTEIVICITPKVIQGHDSLEKVQGTIKPYKTYSTE
jgi:type II secretory pathway component GspD/PulD (secretin)